MIAEHFFDRYPHLLFPSLSWSPIEPPARPIERWIKQLKIDRVDLLYIYGIDDGSVYQALKPWLTENQKRRIVFLADQSGYVAFLLQKKSPLLEDPQVEIAVDFTVGELAEKFPADQVEIVALPGRSNAHFRRLRLELLQQLSLERSFYLERIYGHLISKRFILNFPRVQEAFYANRLKQAFQGIPAIICGAGPSLEHDLPVLKELDSRAILIAGGSAVGALTTKGIEPHFAMAVDPNLEEFHRFRNSFYFEGPFLFSTRLCPQVFATANGPFGYLRSGVGSVPELWLEEELGIDDEPLLGADLDQKAIAVTPLAVAFAHLLGCNPIILTGVDLAYTSGRRYASSVPFEESLKQLEAEKNATNQLLMRKDKQGRRVATAVRWEMERLSLAAFARKKKTTTWINATQGGLRIQAFQECSLADAIAPFSQQPNLKARILQEIEKHPMPSIPNVTENLDLGPSQSPGVGRLHLAHIANMGDDAIAPTAGAFAAARNQIFNHVGYTDGVLQKLKLSLERAVDCLEILAGEKKGSDALAELDLLDEVATSVFLADLPKACRQHFGTKSPTPHEKWGFFLKIARNHLSFFKTQGS